MIIQEYLWSFVMIALKNIMNTTTTFLMFRRTLMTAPKLIFLIAATALTYALVAWFVGGVG